MVTIYKILNLSHSIKAYSQRLYKECCLKITIKKGLTAFNRCKPLVIMVGTRGFEPRTSTVCGSGSGQANQLISGSVDRGRAGSGSGQANQLISIK